MVTASRTDSAVEYWVRTAPPYCSSIARSLSTSTSSTVSFARMPAAMAMAFAPATPAPSTTTRQPGAPGTPPRSMPRPPAERMRW